MSTKDKTTLDYIRENLAEFKKMKKRAEAIYDDKIEQLASTYHLDPSCKILLKILLVNHISDYTAFDPRQEITNLIQEVNPLLEEQSQTATTPSFPVELLLIENGTPRSELNPEAIRFLSNSPPDYPLNLTELSPIQALNDFSIWTEDFKERFLRLTSEIHRPLIVSCNNSSGFISLQDQSEMSRVLKSSGRNLFVLCEDIRDNVFLNRLSTLNRLTRSVILVPLERIKVDISRFQAPGFIICTPYNTNASFLVSSNSQGGSLNNGGHGSNANLSLMSNTCLPINFESSITVLGIWEGLNNQFDNIIDKDSIGAIASVFPLKFDQIYNILTEAQALRTSQKQESQADIITLEALTQLARQHNSVALEAFTKKISPTYTLEDCILPAHTATRLYQVREHVRNKALRDQLWGFQSQHSRGHATVCVFKGKSGTGKTMAAEALAHDLGVDLYRVDLSSITSKYVGETEKNLSQIFRAAEQSAGILFFDEGESLFSSRQNVKSSQDRYANLEVNYLLQELEAFHGFVIISTNHAGSIDSAFLRRITFEIQFPYPDEHIRERIWRNHLRSVLKGDEQINFKALSNLNLTGGTIRNVINVATGRAVSAHRAFAMKDIWFALRLELQKLGSEIRREDFNDSDWRWISPDWEVLDARKELRNFKSGINTTTTTSVNINTEEELI